MGDMPTDDRRAHDGPPWFADPRRIGGAIGLIGALVFVFSYSDGVGAVFAWFAKALAAGLALATLFHLFVRRRGLGPMQPPGLVRILVYLGCVAGEIALFAAGTALLEANGVSGLRPALIAGVVGLHFIPFGWAFGERMFHLLGGGMTVLGAIGMLSGQAVPAQIAAVLAGLFMAAVLMAYALGAFAGHAAAETRES